jgi:hypothetical protein
MVETSAPPTKYGNLIIVQFMAMVKPLERLKMSLGFTIQGSGASRAPVMRANSRKDGDE